MTAEAMTSKTDYVSMKAAELRKHARIKAQADGLETTRMVGAHSKDCLNCERLREHVVNVALYKCCL